MTPATQTLRLEVRDPSGIGAARRAAMQFADSIGFDATEQGEVGIVATEAASNIVRHAEAGEILIRGLSRKRSQRDERGLEILALDRGPGILDSESAIADGWSTAGSMGSGLGAIGRLSFLSDLYSRRGGGLALRAELWGEPTPRPKPLPSERVPFEWGAVCIPLRGQDVCGDAWSVESSSSRARILVMDGLGHGPEAMHAARLGLETAAKHPDAGPARTMELVHSALRPTRGAAALLVDVELGRGTVVACGVGNVAASILSAGGPRQVVSQNGTLGLSTPRFQEFQWPWPSDGLLLVRTDGIFTHCGLDDYPGLLSHHPALAAAVIYRDFARGTDDATVVALRSVRT